MELERAFSTHLPSAGTASRLRRLHALAGAVPLAGFLLLHLSEQGAVLGGRAGYADGPGALAPAELALEILLVYVPLGFHAGYGLYTSLAQARAARRQGARLGARGLARRTIERRALQLATGVIVGSFLLLHLWQFRVRLWSGELDRGDFFDELCASLSSTTFGGVPLMALYYLLALAAVAFHFASGLHGACRTWGLALSERSARVTTGVFVAAGVGLFVLGALTVIYLATGSVGLPSAG